MEPEIKQFLEEQFAKIATKEELEVVWKKEIGNLTKVIDYGFSEMSQHLKEIRTEIKAINTQVAEIKTRVKAMEAIIDKDIDFEKEFTEEFEDLKGKVNHIENHLALESNN